MKGLGLKGKILLGLSGLLVLTIATNLWFSNNLFVDDKRAYIFENVLNNTENVKKIINESIENALFQSESLVLLSRFDQQKAKELFEKQEGMDAFYLIMNGDPAKKTMMMKSTYPEKSEEHPDFVHKWLQASNVVSSSGITINKVSNHNLFDLRVKDSEKTFGLLINMEPLWSRLSGDLVFNYLVVDSKNQIYWQTGTKSAKELLDLVKSNGNTVAKEIEIDNERYLASVASIPKYNIHVIGYIPGTKAYAVLGNLTVKTMAFGIILLGIALIVGLVFSSRLTTPIKGLMMGASHISEGNFGYQVEITSKDELSVLGSKFNFMAGKIKDLLGEKEVIIDELREANIKIEDYSRNLEKKVEERTKELKSANDFIQAMIDSLDQGLFVFGPDLKCSPIYTRACEELFGKSPAGITFSEVLGLDEEQTSKTEKWAGILFQEKLPFDSAVGLGVKQKTFNAPDDHDYKVLSLHYHPMRNEEGKIENVVAVATDKTDEVRAIEESKKKQQYVEMIFKILGGKKQFVDLNQEIEEYLKNLDQALSSGDPELDKAMMIYHTFTGGLAMYSVEPLVVESRKCEQTIVDMKKNSNVDIELLRQQKEEFKEKYSRFRDETFETLGFNSRMIEVDLAIVLYLNDLVQKTSERELKHIFNERFMKVAIEDFLVPYKNLLPALAPKLGKEFAPLNIINGDIRVDPEAYREFFSSLVHLFRNCADHGIEAPYIREERQKSVEGHIKVSAKLQDQGRKLQLVIEDDGAGIDPERIRAKLRERDPENTLIVDESDENVIYHIFDQDFSTAEEVTTISGRGVGMSAIKDIVDRMQGNIRLESQVGKGTKFIFELPFS